MAVEVEGVVEGGMRAEHALEDSPPVQSWARQDASEACARIIAPIGSSCAARSIEVSEMTAYGALQPVAEDAAYGRRCLKPAVRIARRDPAV